MGRRKKGKKDTKEEKARVHEELEGLEFNINEFGEIESNFEIEKLNKFLNKYVDDKKLRGRDDIEGREDIDDEDDFDDDDIDDDDIDDDDFYGDEFDDEEE